MIATRLSSIAVLLTVFSFTTAHGGSHAPQKPLSLENIDDWATLHMASEHRIGNFDPSSFFKLHDFDSDGHWEASEIQRTYGVADGSYGLQESVSEQKKQEVVSQVLEMYDFNRDGFVTMLEWMTGIGSGKRLPDMGTGPGHHGDDEYEYELHHWDLYHDENTTEAELTHPEDIEHFRKHDEEDDEAARQAERDRRPIVLENIPAKFRRSST